MKLIPIENRKNIRCHFCGETRSVKYIAEVFDPVVDDKGYTSVYCCNRCALQFTARDERQTARPVPEIRNRMMRGCLVNVFPWVDGKSIYVNVQEYKPGGRISDPVSDKTVYIAMTDKGINFVENFLDTLVCYIQTLNIPKGHKFHINVE